ncbi:MAG: DEAD/DEAH box helicase, partial [Desulfovibrionaceae bacterium]|nr:DEAD/DEAH box helicase [Desulfovibrionaceae bacterium]
AVRAKIAADGLGGLSEPRVRITTAIDKHDEDEPDKIAAPDKMPFYQGDLHKEALRYTFKDYQEEGTRWILGLMGPLLSQKARQPYHGGLLADDMGLGKTFMVLAALNVYLDKVRGTDRDKPVLAVMPVVLLENWQQEIRRVFKDAPGPFRDIVVLQAGRDLARFRRRDCRMNESRAHGRYDMPSLESGRYALTVGEPPEFLSEREKCCWERLDIPGRLVLTNYNTLRDYQFSLSLVSWSCVIFDEAQEIKNPNALKSRAAKALNADFRLAMTGTPVENSLKDFWSIFDTILPGVLGSFQQFNRRYLSPISRAASEAEKTDLKMSLGRELRSRVGPFMMCRSKEEKLEGLPSKTVHNGGTDNAYCAVMSGEQLLRYNSVVATVLDVKKSGNARRLKEVLFPSLRRLRDVSLHPALLEGEPRRCRSRSEAEAELRRSAKLSLLLDILEEIRRRDEKVIIFVINKKLQLFLAYALRLIFQLDISIVNGDTPSVASVSRRGAATRIQLIRQFEGREGFQIICMSPLAAGVGLTVTGANNVIHLERHWNPAREAQATDRVYRIGATKDVHVYIPLLLHPKLKSFDRNLDELLQRKVLLKDAVVVNNAVQPDDFNAGELFGDNVTSSERVSAGWLEAMSRENFVALAAVVAGRTFGGKASITTKKTAEYGADVVVLCADYGVAVHCRLCRRPFAQAVAAGQPQQAAKMLEEHYGRPFRTAVLAVNAPSVDQDVLREAERLGTVVWDKSFFYEYLCQHEVLYNDLAEHLYDTRLYLGSDIETE